MNTAQPKAIMVDVDGVVVHPNDSRGWSATMEDDIGLPYEALRSEFFAPHFGDIVVGRAALRDRLAPVLARIAPGLDCDTVCEYWFSHDARLDHDLLGQLAALRADGVAVHLATVQETERAEYLWNRLGLRDHFDAMHYSAALGHAKPAPEFYSSIEDITGYVAGDLFFVDDRPANVAAARDRGWAAAVWTGRDTLADLIAGTTRGARQPLPRKRSHGR